MNQSTPPTLPRDTVLHHIDGIDIWIGIEVQDHRDQLGSYRAGEWILRGFTILACGDTQTEFLDALIQQAKKAHNEIWERHHKEQGAKV